MSSTDRIKPTIADYPFVNQVQDPGAQRAVHLLNDKLASVSDAATPLQGTLSPDQRPLNLDRRATDLLFYSTDFDRIFRWTGTGWEDAPGGGEPRNLIGWFWQPTPVVSRPGWALCNNSVVQQTDSQGNLVRLQTPIVNAINGLVAYIRL